MKSIRVKQCMSSPVKGIDVSKTMRDAAEKMSELNIGSLLVLDGDDQVGIITERDMVKAIANEDEDESVALYTGKPLITIHENSPLGDAAQQMLSKKIRRLIAVNDDGKVSGIINIRDISLAVHEGFLALFDL